ncbi:zeta-crystallin [Aspergillus udagawae]|uniref:Zeta-crystallin n=1 Tax=Aspergillus udagawae TaxID=91492 RepID=A0ABQ1AGA9_9EURO|nr:zeta-crystallin [Aspergillus udagawae]GFF81347.1 zeta-crystallin [Aspergillus udagawae]GFG02289.1 zeta-crystallin [Aspergillus udagawae]GFG20509.1 zeta-crystallin [Aspergillus udagawae]
MPSMKAIILHTPGPPDTLKLTHHPIPIPKPGELRIRIKAFGLNRCDLLTRQGHHPITYPRIPGIEAVGIVDTAPGLEHIFPLGSIVATAMGGMGTVFDGGYAEYTCVPAGQTQLLRPKTTLPWEILGAIPVMVPTAWGALIRSLGLRAQERLLIRGGSTSVGLAAAAIAKVHGAYVASTTRMKERETMLLENGVDRVWIDDGAVAEQIRAAGSGAYYDKVLELVGAATLADSLRCVKKGGIVSLVGRLCENGDLETVDLMELIPSGIKLTVYRGTSEDFMSTPLDAILRLVEQGSLKFKIGQVLRMEQIVEAHRCMEENKAEGKIVILP